MKQVLFYSSVKNKELFFTQRFYTIDIDILKNLGYNVILSNRIFDAFSFWKYDFVFAYFYKWSFFVALIAQIFKKNTYFTGGIDDLDNFFASRKKYIIQKIFFYLCYSVSKSCILVSKTDYKNVMSLFSSPRLKKISYSEHTINVQNFSTDLALKNDFFSTIVWMGGDINVKRKGVDTALRVFALLKETPQYKNYNFIIIGKKGEGTKYITELINELNLSDSVILTDMISEEEKIMYLKRSKYYFQLSLYEGFGLAALEALAAKNIVIHSNKGGLSNPIFKNGIHYNIENNIKDEVNLLVKNLANYDTNNLAKCFDILKENYSNKKRQEIFTHIIKE